jgi:cell division septation protein DedD
MNLAVYLTDLLKTNDCVIIPDLGGFIANYLPAVSNSQGDQFYPPAKELIFNSKLKKNDGLLVNHISEREGIGYLEARKIVSEFVSECIFRLENGERIEFEQIGSLRYDSGEHLIFEADKTENLRTDTFGLQSFHFPRLINKYAQPAKPVFKDKAPEPQTHRRPVVKYLLITLPVIAALYLVPKFILNEPSVKQQNAGTASISLTDSPATASHQAVSETAKEVAPSDKQITSDSKIQEADATKDNMPVVASPGASNVLPAENTPIQAPGQISGKFYVVGGCFKIRENAEKLADQLAKQGYHPEVSALGKEFFRVSVESFQDRKEAESVLAKLQEAEPQNGYWLMVDKK